MSGPCTHGKLTQGVTVDISDQINKENVNYFGYSGETILISPFADRYSFWIKGSVKAHLWASRKMTGKSLSGKQETMEPHYAIHSQYIK